MDDQVKKLRLYFSVHSFLLELPDFKSEFLIYKIRLELIVTFVDFWIGLVWTICASCRAIWKIVSFIIENCCLLQQLMTPDGFLCYIFFKLGET